jgi:hypothetical protein
MIDSLSLTPAQTLAATQTLALEYLGVTLGLFTALQQHKCRDSESLAYFAETNPGYTLRWVEAALCAELIVQEDDRLSLSSSGRCFVENELEVAHVMQSI